ncbi:hypothetical protein B9G98_04665 [Wickerhamiella sorbophila]|uniref:Major facilitator superfamily (MFS) profile domain-containing protein n=1 Tax=Wickerhamiella sorbophila TaxID=45607 RepID=A0A2T0FPY9_9ASCO|nr:hypothetical protein B9G98_04665 [Wickerhamiella sorbophila]PRT57045.1 hypothetical protein B9G98_04665 [Wickerhamiella sorbophila]
MTLARRYDSEQKISWVQKVITWIAVFELGLLCGIEAVFFAVVSNTAPFDFAYANPSSIFQGLTTALYPIFAAIGSVSVLFLVQFSSARKLLVASVWIWLAGYLMVVLVINRGGLIVGRMFKGYAIGVILSVIPSYAQTVFAYPTSARLLIAVQASIPLGILIISLLSTQIYHKSMSEIPFHRIWVLAGIPAFPAVLLTVFIVSDTKKDRRTTMNELLNQSQKRVSTVVPRSHRIRSWLRRVKTNMKNPVEEVKAMLASSKDSKGFLFACMTQVSVPLTGINVVLYFVGSVCKLVGVENADIASFSLGIYACNFAATILSIFLVDKMPPIATLRWTLIALSFIQGFTGVLLSMAQHQDSSVSKHLGITALVLLFVFVFVFSAFYAGVSYVVTTDACPKRYRNTALGLAIAAGWLVNAAYTVVATKIMEKMGPFTFCVFGFTCALFGFFFVFVEPDKAPS